MIILYISAAILFLCLVFLFLIYPSARRHPDISAMEGMYIAHRGLHDLPEHPGTPENSLAAFREAITAGYAVETDIHLTSDGETVVFHDDTLERMCGVGGSPEKMTLSELRGLKLGSTEERIPTLSELLSLTEGKVPLLIEFKCASRAGADALCRAAAPILDKYSGKYYVQSFNPYAVGWYRKNRPGVCRGQLSAAFRRGTFVKKLAGCLLFNAVSRPDFVSYRYGDASHICRRLCTKLGAHPVCWTLHSQAELESAKAEYSFKTFIFEGFIPEAIPHN